MNILNLLAGLFYIEILGYIDPGTGSIILQAIVAAVVGVGVAIKLFWHRILKFLGIRKSVETDDGTIDQ